MNYSTELLAEVKEDINGISANGGLYIYASKEGIVEVRRSGVANYNIKKNKTYETYAVR
tara:strand:+ start:24 stop:200 length:177 start_codon:yes stop_codon:yes gene_type:complete